MEFKLISKYDDLMGFRPQWNELLDKSSDKSITQTWEWLFTWWKIYGEERQLFFVVAYENDKAVGIAPFSLAKKKNKYFLVFNYTTLWFMGAGRTTHRNVTSDYLNLIVMQGKEEHFVDSLVRWLSQVPFWDEIVLENVSSDSKIPDLLKQASRNSALSFEVTQQAPSILIKLPASWDDFVQSISSSLRYKIRRGRKEFEKLNGRYHLVQCEEALPEAFNHLEILHQHRWRAKGKFGAFSSSEWRAFHRELMPMLLRNGWLRLSFLDLDGNPVAANYSFFYDNKLHFFQSGMIPHQNKHVRLGLILHSYCIEEAINQGVQEYDFLKAGYQDREYKEMWGNYSRDLLNIRIARKTNKERLYGCAVKTFDMLRTTKHWAESRFIRPTSVIK